MENVSWLRLAGYAGAAVFFYYLVVIRSIIIQKLKERKRRVWTVKEDELAPAFSSETRQSKSQGILQDNQGDQEDMPDEELAFNELERCAETIQDILSAINIDSDSKGVLLSRLQTGIQKYPLVNRQPFKIAISNLIVREAAYKLGFNLTEEEIIALWSDD